MNKQINLFDENVIPDNDINELLSGFVKESNDEEFEFSSLKILNGYSFKCYKVVWLWILNKKDYKIIQINNSQKNFFNQVLEKEPNAKLENGKITIITYNVIETLLKIKEPLIHRYNYIREKEPVEYFGCCSHFTECSDNKACVQVDKKLAKGCAYKKNLQNNRIFYGVNRNVD